MKGSISERQSDYQRFGNPTPSPDKYYTFLIILTVRKLHFTSKLNFSLVHAVPRSWETGGKEASSVTLQLP